MSPLASLLWIAAISGFAAIVIGIIFWRERSLRRAIELLSVELERQSTVIATISATRPSRELAFTAKLPRRDRTTRGVPKGPTLIAVPDLVKPSPEVVAMPAELQDRFGAIWNMADNGISDVAIARETGLPIGQVQLILGLRRKRPAEQRG